MKSFMYCIKREKGFTLIELLVVVGIIAILSAIVLGLISNGRGKASDSAIQSELSSLKNQAALYAASNTPPNSFNLLFTTNNSWSSANVNVNSILANINKKSVVHTAGSSASSWAAQVRLVSDTSKYLCIDSNLNFITGTTAMVAGSTVCP